jgi:hypothetical protein
MKTTCTVAFFVLLSLAASVFLHAQHRITSKAVWIEISGGVANPGMYRVNDGMEARDAVKLAGIASYSRLDRVIVMRGSAAALILDLTTRPPAGHSMPMRDGDIVRVGGVAPPTAELGAKVRLLTESYFPIDQMASGYALTLDPSVVVEASPNRGFSVPSDDGAIPRLLLYRVNVLSSTGEPLRAEASDRVQPEFRGGRLILPGENAAFKLLEPVRVLVPKPDEYTITISIGYSDQCPSNSYLWLTSEPVRIRAEERSEAKPPNKSLQPTATAVMPPAAQEARQP